MGADVNASIIGVAATGSASFFRTLDFIPKKVK